MKESPITMIGEHERGGRRVRRAIEARRSLVTASGGREARRRGGGRAWINGLELGGTDSRHLPLAVQFD